MPDTPNLALPLIAAAQAQKHVTHNEALLALDALLQCAVKDKDLTAPPAAPSDGNRYIVAASSTGAWAGKAGQIAAWQDGVWRFYAPKAGMIAFVIDETTLYIYNGTSWGALSATLSALQNLTLLGLGTTADAANLFSTKLNNVLHAAKTVAEDGTGTIQVKLSKESAAKTASYLFQTNFSGRAEFGLTGDDDSHLKVSPDGGAWSEALKARRADGKVSFPQGVLHDASAKAMSGLIFTPGGDGQVSIYRNDTARGQHPRAAAVSSIAGDLITLAAADAGLFFHANMARVSYVRIWNVSKTPAQSAWVKASPASNALQVLSAASIAGWLAGETVQIGDPTDVTPNRVIALDISPMLQTVLGAAFRQTGILCKASVVGVGANLSLTPTGVTGSFVALNSSDAGVGLNGMILIACSQLSPVSNTNLVFLREGVTSPNQLGITIASAIAVFG